MIMKAKPPHVRNGILWYSIAKEFALDDLRDACMKTVGWNMEYLISSNNQIEWFRCEFDFLRDLLLKSNIVISNEYRLYQSIIEWLLTQSSESLITTYANELLPLIRFSQMLPQQLYQIEQSTFYQKNTNQQVQTLLQRLLSQAYRFHTLAPLRQNCNQPEFLPLDWYLPREYTEMNITYEYKLFLIAYCFSLCIVIVLIFNRRFVLVFKLMFKHVHRQYHRLIVQLIGKLSIVNVVMINGH